MRNYTRKIRESVYGDYPEDVLKPLNTFGTCLCGEECNCEAFCQCGDPDCAQCGDSLNEAVLEEEECSCKNKDQELEETSVAGAVSGPMQPLGYEDNEPLSETVKITETQLRRIIRKAINEAFSIISENSEAYVRDAAEDYIEKTAIGQREDYDGYLEFGAEHGYDEAQLEQWFEEAHEREYDAWLAKEMNKPRDGIKRAEYVGAYPGNLRDDLSSGKIDLQRNPYALD